VPGNRLAVGGYEISDTAGRTAAVVRALSAPTAFLVRRAGRRPELRPRWIAPLRDGPFGDGWALCDPGLFCFRTLVPGLTFTPSTSPVASAEVTNSAHAPRAANT
jgi:hypothetical protein